MGDVTLLQGYVGYPGQYTICSQWAADVNCSGEINMGDVTLLQGYVGYPNDYQLNCCPTTTPTPTPTLPPSTPLLDFAVKFQGIGAGRSEPADQMAQIARVQVKESGGLTHQFSGVNLVYNRQTGFYSPETAIPLVDVPAGNNYTIYIKGPKHLQKRFCSDGQTSRCFSGQGRIALVVGANTFDFSGVALEAGDLPNPDADPQQDGVVNSIDVELLRSHYCRKVAEYGFPACTQADLDVADLDSDGYVFDSDMQLIRNTLSAVYEDDEE